MRIKEERKQRVSITVLFSVIVIVIFVTILLLVGLSFYVLIRIGVFADTDRGNVPMAELILIFVGACTVVGSILTFLVSQYPMQPVHRLLTIMSRLAAGDFTVRIDVPKPWNRHAAIKELSESFNKMAAELQGTEMLRSDFINNFSHEFKTPIVSIAGFAKLLKREQLTPQQAEYVRIIEEESLRLSAMATNVLNMTKVENQSILTDVSSFNLSEQLRACILLLSSEWERKEIEFAIDVQEHTVTGNEELLKHVWINLIDNAIKFSPHGGTVEIAIAETPVFTEVSISNQGIAIPQEQQGKIFNKFYQADESHATHGNGVGLAIVKKVVELHNGRVCVRSERGTTCFSVRLPRQ